MKSQNDLLRETARIDASIATERKRATLDLIRSEMERLQGELGIKTSRRRAKTSG